MSINPHPTSTSCYVPFHRRLFDRTHHTCSSVLQLIDTALYPILQKHPNLTPQDVLLTVFLTFVSLCLLVTSFADGWYWVSKAVDLGLLGWAGWQGLRVSNGRYGEEDGWKRRVEFVFQYTTLGIVFSLFEQPETEILWVWIWVGRMIRFVWLAHRWMGQGHSRTSGLLPASAIFEARQKMEDGENADDIRVTALTAGRIVHQASQTDPIHIHTLLAPDVDDDPHPTAILDDTLKTRDLLPSPQLLCEDKGPESLCSPGMEMYRGSNSSDDSGSASSSLSAGSDDTWNAEEADEAAEAEERSAGSNFLPVGYDKAEPVSGRIGEIQDGHSVKVDTAFANVTSLEQKEGKVEHMGMIHGTNKQSEVGSQPGPSPKLEKLGPIDYQKILGDRDETQRKSEIPVKQPKEPFEPSPAASRLEETAPNEGRSVACEPLHPVVIAPLAPLRLSRRRSNGKPDPTIQRGSIRAAEGKEPAEETTYKALQRFRSGLAELDPTFTFDRRRQTDDNGRATAGHRRARTIDVRMSTTARLDELLGFEDEFGVKT